MPDKTADALARILSLSGSSSQADNRKHSDDKPSFGPGQPELAGAERSTTPASMSCMFFEVVDDSNHAAGLPRFGSTMSWAEEYSDSILANGQQHGREHQCVDRVEGSPWNAHGPENYGSFKTDPYGPGDWSPQCEPTPQATSTTSAPFDSKKDAVLVHYRERCDSALV